MQLYCVCVNVTKTIVNKLMICNVRWYMIRVIIIRVFDNNSTNMLLFYQSEIDRQQPFQVHVEQLFW
jgi:hypothetical protein